MFGYVVANPLRYIDIFGLLITGSWVSFTPAVNNWDYTGLTADLKRDGLQDQLVFFNFLISGSLAAEVECKEVEDGECRTVTNTWRLSGSVSVSNLKFKVPYKEPFLPIPGMSLIIWIDKVVNVSQYWDTWEQMIETTGVALLNSPTKICKGSSFLK